jgi:hypothetical protein
MDQMDVKMIYDRKIISHDEFYRKDNFLSTSSFLKNKSRFFFWRIHPLFLIKFNQQKLRSV